MITGEPMEKLILERLDKLNDKLNSVGVDVATVTTSHQNLAQTLTEIKEQTTKTNGRVGSLEDFKTKIIAYATAIGFIAAGLFRLIV